MFQLSVVLCMLVEQSQFPLSFLGLDFFSSTSLYTVFRKKWYIGFFHIFLAVFLTNFMKLSNSGIYILKPMFLHEADC